MIAVAVAFRIWFTEEYKKSGMDRWVETTQHYIPRILFSQKCQFTAKDIDILDSFCRDTTDVYFESNKGNFDVWGKTSYYFIPELSQRLVEMLGIDKYRVATVDDELQYTNYSHCKNSDISSEWYYVNIAKYPRITVAKCRNNDYFYIAMTPSYKYGLYTSKGEAVLPCKYDWIYHNNEYSDSVEVNGHTVSNLTPDSERLQLLNMYDWVEYGDNNIKYTELENKYGLIFPNGIVIKCEYDKIELNGDIFILHKGNKQGVLSIYGEYIIPTKYDSIYELNNCAFRIESENKVGVINKQGELIVPIEFDDIIQSCDGTLRVYNSNKMGIMNEYGRFIIPIKYTNIFKINDSAYIVRTENGEGVVDILGDNIIPAIYENIEVNEMLIGRPVYKVSLNNKVGVFDNDGTTIVPCEYENVLSCNSTQCVIACITERENVLYCNGRQVSRIYQKINNFNEGVAAINMGGYWKTDYNRTYFTGGKWGLINESGKVIMLCNMFRKLFYIGNGRYIAMDYNIYNKRVYQVIDKQGHFIKDIKFDVDVDDIQISGLRDIFIVVSNNRYGLYSSDGVTLLSCHYDKINIINIPNRTEDETQSNIVLGVYNNKYGLFSSNGDEILKCTCDRIEVISIPHRAYNVTPMYRLKILINGKYGLYSLNGEQIIDCRYDDIGEFEKNLSDKCDNAYIYVARVKLNEKYGYINNNGEIIIPIKYNYLDESYSEQSVEWVTEDISNYYAELEQDYRDEMEEAAFYALTDGQCGDYNKGDWDQFIDSLGH